jgi:enolase-phosphatase E1
MAITHLLLDIEGTTCPVSFVADVLFPYARRQLHSFLAANGGDPEVAQLVQQVQEAWAADSAPEAMQLLQSAASTGDIRTDPTAVVPYLQWLIDHDVKLTALKDLQGRIWKAGYSSGELVAPLFADVPEALQRWHQQGYTLAVYSSGSVPAQQLLYAHSQAGDLRPLFSHWFDTRIGPKQRRESYQAIAAAMQVPTSEVLFISDALSELLAADAAGMPVLFSDREGNPARDSGSFERIHSYSTLEPRHGNQPA